MPGGKVLKMEREMGSTEQNGSDIQGGANNFDNLCPGKRGRASCSVFGRENGKKTSNLREG